MKIALRLTYVLAGVLVLSGAAPSRAFAQDHDSHRPAQQEQPDR